ncbi:MAG TPA: hypothetical protein DD757_04800 [Alcanivorax sp.]|nr:hypothetical protein [Alcanivorax sp.]MAD72028.1 hypothetical protein [Alcanivorax sp.]HBP75160.1 hypothetical protein [Alcanivorax sp.]
MFQGGQVHAQHAGEVKAVAAGEPHRRGHVGAVQRGVQGHRRQLRAAPPFQQAVHPGIRRRAGARRVGGALLRHIDLALRSASLGRYGFSVPG